MDGACAQLIIGGPARAERSWLTGLTATGASATIRRQVFAWASDVADSVDRDGRGFLAPDEAAACSRWHPLRPARPLLLVCDHASARIPQRLGSLGLTAPQLRTHIAWDIGAGWLTLALARLLGVPAVLAGYSRLVIDCNRWLDDPTSVVARSDGTAVPGNHGLGGHQLAQRREALYWPYHRAISEELDALTASGGSPVMVAIHSFTPSMAGIRRPWHVGVLWDRDSRLAGSLLARLRGEPGLVVGDNKPYSGREPAGFTMDHHAGRRELAHVTVEVRQDLLLDAAGVAAWAARLQQALGAVLDDLPVPADPAAREWQRGASASGGRS